MNCNKDCRSLEKPSIDTVINRYQIDSILLVIKHKDSVIVDIKRRIEYEKDKADSLNDDDAVKLFKELVSE